MSPRAASPSVSRWPMARRCRARSSSIYYKSDELADPLVSEEHITAFGWATPQDLDDMMSLALRINDFLTGLFLGIGMRLSTSRSSSAGYRKNERHAHRPGRRDQLPTAAGCGTSRPRKLDKDRFRHDLGGVDEAYQEVARRLGILPEGGPGDFQGPEMIQ